MKPIKPSFCKDSSFSTAVIRNLWITLLVAGIVALLAGTYVPALAANPGDLDLTFDPGSGANDTVLTLAVQPDGKIIIIGDFTEYNGTPRNHIARLNADGSLDTSFNPGSGANGIVRALALQPDGKIVIGGRFTEYDGSTRRRFARLNADGSLDTSFSPYGVWWFLVADEPTVEAIAIQPDGKIVIGGDFNQANLHTMRYRIARYHEDGSLDYSFNSDLNSPVYALALQADGKIIIGGSFTSCAGTPCDRIARLNANGSLDTSFNDGANNTVYALALQPDGKLLIGGHFTSYDGVVRPRVARLNANGSLDESFDPGSGANGPVHALALQPDGKLLIGGGFTEYDGVERHRLARLNADGSLDESFDPGSGANDWVDALALQPDGNLVIGGSFTEYAGVARSRIARVHLAQIYIASPDVDTLTKDALPPTFSGTTIFPGATVVTVTHTATGEALCVTTAIAGDAWNNCTPPAAPLPPGDHIFVAIAGDGAGAESAPSPPVRLTIDPDVMRPADLVLGQPDFISGASGTSQTTLNQPTGVAVDPTTGKVFVADRLNHRVLRYASTAALRNGAPAESVLGQADFTSGSANRGAGVAANTFFYPIGVFVDTTGRLWVADEWNNRVLWFNHAASKADGAPADGVLGQADFTSRSLNRGTGVAANTLYSPRAVWVDAQGHLWVADGSNHRVLRFANAATLTNGQNASSVLGQPNFTSRETGLAANRMNEPNGLVVSADGALFVADMLNHRVLRFDNAAAKADGAPADGVLGQSNFTTAGHSVTRSGMDHPSGLALAPDGRLFVVERDASRVIIYADAANKANGAPADGLLGQPDSHTGGQNTGGLSAASLDLPGGAFYDPVMNVLWVADADNHRVLVYAATSFTVHVTGIGSGLVERVPDQQIYALDSTVVLIAHPYPGSTFTGWGGDCTGENVSDDTCALLLDTAHKEVSADFDGPLTVCGPDLTEAAFPHRCRYPTIAAALAAAGPGDAIAISGVVIETVVVTQSVTIRGPYPSESTPGTHMGIVQAAPTPGSGAGSVFSITAGVQVTITNLNIRHGDAAQGGGIHNAGELTLQGVTLSANRGDQGGALYNSGSVTLLNSTLSDNEAGAGGSLYNAATGAATVQHSTLAVAAEQSAANIENANPITGSVTVSGAILSAPSAEPQCQGVVASAGHNLRHGGECFAASQTGDLVGDPLLGALRDNGGPTLTRALDAASPAIEAGPPAGACPVAIDQRGAARPFGDACDIGAVEHGTRTLTVCADCFPNLDALRFDNVQAALNWALAGDRIVIEAGAYTGNFVAYRDVTLQHAGVDVAALNRQGHADVRAILQGHEEPPAAQYAALDAARADVSPPVLTIQAYTYPPDAAAPVVISGDVHVTLQDLTVRYGLSRHGGGILNRGHLHLLRTTVADNATVNALDAEGLVTVEGQGGGIYNVGTLTLERSTISGNRAESFGGGIYNAGVNIAQLAQLDLRASTVAANEAAPFPTEHTLTIAGLFSGGDVEFRHPITEAVSGDRLYFHNQVGNDIAFTVSPAGACNVSSITLPVLGLSQEPLICHAATAPVEVTLSGGSSFPLLHATITFHPPAHPRAAHGLYDGGHSRITLAHSILVNPAVGGTTCRMVSNFIQSHGYNLADDTSCRLWAATDLRADARLGPLQDNNHLDFVAGALSGYVHTHALWPDSPAIDRIPPEVCGAQVHTVVVTPTIAAGALDLTGAQSLRQGDLVQWVNARPGAVTVALHDGQADLALLSTPAGATTRQWLFATPGDYHYQIYDNASRERLGEGTIAVLAHTRATDQRGARLPLRGATGSYHCDVGAYEFQPWVVGEALPRPPSTAVSQAPLWYLGIGENRSTLDADTGQSPYHTWNTALLQDIALRPTPPNALVSVDWKLNPDPLDQTKLIQVGVVVWPDAPQLHVTGAPVNMGHTMINEGYMVSSATPFRNRDVDLEASVLSAGIFTRNTYPADTAYTVINWSKTTQSGVAIQVQVVQTVDWNTPGIRDTRADRAACAIGATLTYGDGLDADRHQDPEDKSGYILVGEAYDGARTTIDMARVQNTVNNLIPPAHNRETREGPIIAVLNTAPTAFADPDPVTGGHDLRVAWYRPDARNVAWPVRTVGYRCDWPANPPEIVIASELGSEIGGQALLAAEYYASPAIYHQPDPHDPGYNPNNEHALLSTSNLGNTSPALYALRTDLSDQPYVLLKYLDPRDNDQPKIAVYAVALTRPAREITDVTLDDGVIQLLPANGTAASRALTGNSALAGSPDPLLRVGDAQLPAGGTASVAVQVFDARALRSARVTVQYDAAKITPTHCEPYRQDMVEALYGLSLVSNAPDGIRPLRAVRLRATLEAGTDMRYEWDFGDGLQRVAGAEVTHVYGAVGTYTVRVTAANGLFPEQTAEIDVVVIDDPSAIPVDLPPASGTGCRVETPGEVTLELQTRNKHGLSGNLLLADLHFQAVGAPPPETTATALPISAATLHGPAYEALEFNITAGNPIYAPVPMQSLLDIQPCAQSIPTDMGARPFWRDFRGSLWARAAGEMAMLYFYPLQAGFHLDDAHAVALGLVELDSQGRPLTPPRALPPEERVGRCVPWMDQLSEGTESYADFPMPGDTTYVLPVAYDVTWPSLPALLAVGETVYARPKGGVSGVANQLAVSRIYDDYAPGAWDNDAGRIVMEPADLDRSLAQLIDPISEVRVPLPISIGGNYALPPAIQTERLLFGGGLAIVGNVEDHNLALPFSLRIRTLYDDTTGELVFRGYYDGESALYLRGDPLLLLNVMSLSDKARLQALCPEGQSYCDDYRDAVEALYHKTRNPRQLDLTGNGQPDQAFLIGVQDANGDGIPEPYEGLGKGKALSAGNAAGVGYITLAYNNDPSVGGLPVSLQVIYVGCTLNHLGEDSTYRGNVLVVESDNFFDEKLTLRHTGDFGGQSDNFTFQWWLAPVDDTGVSPTNAPPEYPWQSWTRLEPGMSELGPEITLEGANPTTLSDNWLLVRYQGYPVCGNAYNWSAFAGDPSAKPSEVRAQLAEGWIKRVTAGLNPFDTRVTDYVQAPVNTSVNMIRQAGPRYEGPIAFSGDPDNLNRIGLIEAYQTVLNRGRTLSIDSNINHQGANAALLNVSTRISALYMLLGNDAYMDALDPTVGLSTGSAMGARSAALFSFMNQFSADFGLIDEELALLRGRDETLGGVAAAPTYNRLTWNFTGGDGEVAYVVNYNVKDYNEDGQVNEADAAWMYPQGHGDAWGHHLTAIKLYYYLLRHPHYTWVPRAEPVMVGGAPVVADYYDELRFASAAVNRAKVGADVVNLTYRKQYADPAAELYTDPHIDASDGQPRAWGVADWARRAGQGAYLDWVVGNAILPPIEERYTDVRKIDRTTVFDLAELANQYAHIQEQLDRADNHLNPLGLAEGAVIFDLDPALANSTPGGDGQTHFEQVYDRAIVSLGNAQTLFDYANQMKLAQRDAENEQRDFVTSIIEQDTAIVNELIELFGYPYDADIGVNGTYPEGYDGPDIYNFDLWERTELTDFQKRCQRAGHAYCEPETTTRIVEFRPLRCTGHFVRPMRSFFWITIPAQVCVDDDGMSWDNNTLGIEYRVGTGLDAGYGRFKPESWPESSRRQAPGEIQHALREVYQARMEYERAISAYQNHIDGVDAKAIEIVDRIAVLNRQGRLKTGHHVLRTSLENSISGIQSASAQLNFAAGFIDDFSEKLAKCIPQNAGFTFSVGDPLKCAAEIAGSTPATTLKTIASGLNLLVGPMEGGKDVADRQLDLDIFREESDYEIRQHARELQGLIGNEYNLRLDVYLALDRYIAAQGKYDQVLHRGFRKLEELIRLRQRWAGQISEQRYNDMAYHIFQFEALQKYRRQFDLAQLYTYLTAAAYDYETNLTLADTANGDRFLRGIAVERTLGELHSGQPTVGSGGLTDSMAQMRDNFMVLKGQLGFNNPQYEANRFSLRSGLLRLRDTSDASWQQALYAYYVPNIYANNDVANLAKPPYGSGLVEPGLIIPFGTNIIEGQNFFGRPLGPGDSAYDASQFSTKVAAVGVWFDGYDTTRLAETPRVYLLPAGSDVLRPRNTDDRLRYWNVAEQLLPLPYTLGAAEMADPSWIAIHDGLSGQLFAQKPYARFRAYPYSPTFIPDQMTTDTRLIGRSVWNTRWVLVVPGSALLADSQQGIERFIADVDDIYIYFQTYAYAGTRR